jgi:2'-5' RNA ligase
MDRLAVDIVLLPPEHLMSRAMELNRELIRSNPPKIGLNSKNCVPHISLAMGVLNYTDRESIVRDLRTIAAGYDPLTLQCIGIYAVEIPTGEKVSGIAIENSEELYTLHKDVMELCTGYLTHDATLDMVYAPPEAEEITLHFINRYPENSAYERFVPHITLGIGEMIDPGFSDEFIVTEMAMFHLGNYCTCRKKLDGYVFN